MGAFGVFLLTLLFLGSAAKPDTDFFDLTDALGATETPQNTCPNEARDIVFLIHGSSSVMASEFTQLKEFIASTMKLFPDNTLFSLLQFSNRFQEHFDFRHFRESRDPQRLLIQVKQLGGSTHMASGIRKAVRELFTTQKGARNTAKKLLIIVTAGQKAGDPLEYSEVVEEAERAGVKRFAIGVGTRFLLSSAQRELHAIASHPATEHALHARRFTSLQDIQTQLKEKICASHGPVAPKPTSTLLLPEHCTSRLDPQVLEKLERVLNGLDQINTKLDMLTARQGR
ncbi:integrin alpha-M-like [Hemicordylus capensis]|uniref:integrin alpha-M-like n=1 Tax=Hemicordylus capensis TaxID=884348 RepID=UPI002303F92A|nr:integrin alpha-M-like [Hemicordylus capensis]